MADKIINTDTMIGKVIAVMVALLFIVILAFPVANSLSNQGNGGGDSASITYTNTGDYYYKSTVNDNTVHTVNLSYEWEVLTETTMTETYTLTLDGSVIYSYTGLWDEDNPTVTPTTVIPIGWGQDEFFGVIPTYTGDTAFVLVPGDSFTPNINVDSIDSDNSGVDECSFTVQNGIISYTEYGTDTVVTSEYHMDYFITTDTSGEYVLTDTPFKMDDNSLGLICECIMVEDSEHDNWWEAPVYGRFMSDSLVTSATEIELDSFNSTVSSETTIFSSIDNGLITVSKIESEISVTPIGESYTVSDTVSLKAIVPTTVTIDPSAVEVTVTNSGQTYKELDDNSHNIHTETTTNGGITTVTVFSDDVEIMSFNRIDGDYTPKICLAFGEEGSVWLTNRNSLLMISSAGTVVNMVAGSTYMDIINKTYDSHTYGTVNLEYFISNDGEYVYSDTAMSSKIGQIFNIGISLCDVGDLTPIFTSVQSNGTPVSALNDVHVNGYNETNVTSDAHYTVGEYVDLDSLDVTYSFIYDETEYTVDYSTNGFFVPKTFTYTESSDSGSDSEGIGGIASTLVKLVPILLIVGLLMIFVIPMVNRPN